MCFVSNVRLLYVYNINIYIRVSKTVIDGVSQGRRHVITHAFNAQKNPIITANLLQRFFIVVNSSCQVMKSNREEEFDDKIIIKLP